MAALLIILAGCTGLAEGVLIKRYHAKHEKGGFVFTALVSLFSMFFFVLTDKNGFLFPQGIFPYGLIGGVLYCSASFLTYVALGCGSFAISMLILSYSGVFSIVYGIAFLKESISVFTCIGFALIFISLFLTRAVSQEGEKRFSLKWLICIVLSVFGSGMLGVLMRVQQRAFDGACDNEFMIITLSLSATVLLVFGIVKNGRDLWYILRHGGIYAAVAGISNGATNAMGLAINMLMALSISSPIRAGVKVILSFALSKLVFKEHFVPRQMVGVALGGVALIFLNL
ncbi:MAG: EamA family transporter [Clostridia bacterium]|nr:EamA family transporter [Clostridia bacterium]